MWRTELFHPLVVHLPITLLVVGGVMRMLSLSKKAHLQWRWLRPSGRLLLLLGTLGAWLAVYTGELADAEVVRSLCDPTVVKAHETWSWRTAYIFSALVALEAVVYTFGRQLRKGWKITLKAVTLLLIASGIAMLGYVGHLGGKLVYQQGAAVYHPTENCVEFE